MAPTSFASSFPALSISHFPRPEVMIPTVFREGRYRFHFFSLEEDRIHIHVESPHGELKVWLEPRIELAQNHGISAREVTKDSSHRRGATCRNRRAVA